MQHTADNGIKNRLIEPSGMVTEVLRLLASGVPEDRIAVELARLFYVDVDLLNAVLRALPDTAGGEEERAARRTTGDRAAA